MAGRHILMEKESGISTAHDANVVLIAHVHFIGDKCFFVMRNATVQNFYGFAP